MTKTFEICFNDLTPEAQEEYLKFVGAESKDDINDFIPLTIIEIEE